MRRRLLPLAALAVLLSLAGSALWLDRFALATAAIERSLERQELGPVSLTLDAVDFHRLQAHGIALRGGAVRAAMLTASFSPLGLARGHVGSVEIDGLRLALTVAAAGLSADGRPLALPAGGGAFRINRLRLNRASLTLDTPAGPIEAAFSVTLGLAGGGAEGSDFAADVTAPIAGSRRVVRFAAPRLSFAPQAGGGIGGSIAKASVAADGFPWRADDIAANFQWNGEQAALRLAAATVASTQQPAPTRPIALSGSATMKGSTIAFSAAATIEAAGAAGRMSFAVAGRQDRATGDGSAQIALTPVSFRRGGAQPADFFPILAGGAENVAGTVSLGGSLRWRGERLSPDLVLHFAGLGFDRSGMELRQIDGDVRLVRLWPPATPRGQTLSLAVAAAGLPPAKAIVRFAIGTPLSLRIERIAVAVAGGEISAADFTIDPAAPAIDTTLAVDRVDLAEIARLLGIDGLSGSGALGGHIPLRATGSGFTVAGGALAASGPGVLRYRPQKLPPEIAGAGRPVELALQALADFHYSRLTLELDKGAGGEGTVVLRLYGNNPAVLNGHPFDINVRLEGNFDRLVDYALLGLRSADELVRRAKQRSEP